MCLRSTKDQIILLWTVNSARNFRPKMYFIERIEYNFFGVQQNRSVKYISLNVCQNVRVDSSPRWFLPYIVNVPIIYILAWWDALLTRAKWKNHILQFQLTHSGKTPKKTGKHVLFFIDTRTFFFFRRMLLFKNYFYTVY